MIGFVELSRKSEGNRGLWPKILAGETNPSVGGGQMRCLCFGGFLRVLDGGCLLFCGQAFHPQ